MPRIRWGRRNVVQTLQERVAKGLPITTRRVREQFEPLYSAAVYYFRSWRKALKSAGIKPPPAHPRLWTRPEMLEILRYVHRTAGNTLAQILDKHARRGNSGIFNAIRYEFGSLPEARKAAGLPLPFEWSRRKVVSALRQAAKKGPIRYGVLETSNRRLIRAAEKYFGKWRLAVKAAGVRTSWRHNHFGPSMTWTKESVIRILRQSAQTGNVTINPIRAKYAGIYKAAQREFGSWWNALRAAGISP